eukprot:TRINITY_DN10468_c0_g1_i1.p1 TRINITY_DN10468_c0_g1~~TRINITY_DN10468_c0_g1_i1.p1  ORF type:complete len:319 (+),score=68.46 TRINITY_DN10468_c0_g1_i1:14-970(+)
MFIFWVVLLGVVWYIISTILHNQMLNAKGKVVVISGCDSGFGLLAAKRFAHLGAQVYAGCLTESGLKFLRGSKNIVPFQLDMKNKESIDKAIAYIRKECPDGVWALINNAGIAKGLNFELTPIATYREVMEVNLFGHLELTKGILQLIKKKKGRIVNTSSIAGSLSVPGMGAYCISKFGMRAWTDALRDELYDWGVSVSLIQPGFMKTNIVSPQNLEAVIKEAESTIPKEIFDDYGEEWFVKTREEVVVKLANAPLGDPETVVDCYVGGVLSKYPKAYYWVGKDAYLFWGIAVYIPSAWLRRKYLRLFSNPPKPRALQ